MSQAKTKGTRIATTTYKSDERQTQTKPTLQITVARHGGKY